MEELTNQSSWMKVVYPHQFYVVCRFGFQQIRALFRPLTQSNPAIGMRIYDI
jgi:hypothetical protein